jgi:hypothetical protein
MSAIRDEIEQFFDDYLARSEILSNPLQTQFGVETFFCDAPNKV